MVIHFHEIEYPSGIGYSDRMRAFSFAPNLCRRMLVPLVGAISLFFVELTPAQVAFGGPLKTQFTIRVTGTPGVIFVGDIGQATIIGTVSSRSVEGTVPSEYTVETRMVTIVLQKKEKDGTLKVEVLKHRFLSKELKVVAEATTTAEYGIVSLNTL